MRRQSLEVLRKEEKPGLGLALLGPSFLDDSVERNGKAQYAPALTG